MPSVFELPRRADYRGHYERLARETAGLGWCTSTSAWAACSEHALKAVLEHPDLCARPGDQSVPPLLAGTALAEFFANILRQRDDAGHGPLKAALAADLAAWPDEAVRNAAMLAATRWAEAAVRGDIARYPSRCAVEPVARLLGIPACDLDRTCEDVEWLTRAVSPAATAADLEDLSALERLRHGVENSRLFPERLAAMLQKAPRSVVIDNAINLMVQSNDAGAGLIAGSLVERLRLGGETDADLTAAEICPVHNTRRFARRDVALAGRHIPAGAMIVAILAGPAEASARLPFGWGRHACPGERIARITAQAAVEVALAQDLADRIDPDPPLRPLGNARVPVLRLRPAA